MTHPRSDSASETSSARHRCWTTNPPPHAAAAVLTAATIDGFVPTSAVLALHRHWPGSEMAWVRAGHATLLWRHKDRMAEGIVRAFERVEAMARTRSLSRCAASPPSRTDRLRGRLDHRDGRVADPGGHRLEDRPLRADPRHLGDGAPGDPDHLSRHDRVGSRGGHPRRHAGPLRGVDRGAGALRLSVGRHGPGLGAVLVGDPGTGPAVGGIGRGDHRPGPAAKGPLTPTIASAGPMDRHRRDHAGRQCRGGAT